MAAGVPELPPVAARIASDLRMPQGRGEPLLSYLDRILYSAAAEWLRTITFDSDPVLGNSKVGVTRDYLVSRGAEVLQMLARTILPSTEDTAALERASEQIAWMVDSMLYIGELFEPEHGIIALSAESASSGHYMNSCKRLIGRRDQIGFCTQAGLCRYALTQTSEEEASAEIEQRLSAEKALLSVHPALAETVSLGIDEGAAIHEMAAKGEHATEDALLVLTILTASAKERTALLCSAWPCEGKPLTWSSTTHWALANSILG